MLCTVVQCDSLVVTATLDIGRDKQVGSFACTLIYFYLIAIGIGVLDPMQCSLRRGELLRRQDDKRRDGSELDRNNHLLTHTSTRYNECIAQHTFAGSAVVAQYHIDTRCGILHIDALCRELYSLVVLPRQLQGLCEVISLDIHIIGERNATHGCTHIYHLIRRR